MIIYKECGNVSVGQYACDPCDIAENGNVRSLCLIKEGIVLPNPLTQFAIERLIAEDDMYVMNETRGTFDGGTPKYITGYGDNKDKFIGNDYTLNLRDALYAENYEFWSAIEKTQGWNIAFRTEKNLTVVYEDILITTKAAVEEGIDSVVDWNIEAKWFSKNKPQIVPFAVNLFEKVFSDYDYIAGLTIESGKYVRMDLGGAYTATIYMPDGSEIVADGSGSISQLYSGVAGKVYVTIDKNVLFLAFTDALSAAEFQGRLVYNGNANISASSNPFTSIIANNTTSISSGSTTLKTIQAKKATYISADGCAITPQGAVEIIYNAYMTGKSSGNLYISGGTSANYEDFQYMLINGQYPSFYLDALDARDWTVTLNYE